MREPPGSSGGRLAVNSERRRGRHSHLYLWGEDEENGDQQIDYNSRPGSHACDWGCDTGLCAGPDLTEPHRKSQPKGSGLSVSAAHNGTLMRDITKDGCG